jgi:hypothetical protein
MAVIVNCVAFYYDEWSWLISAPDARFPRAGGEPPRASPAGSHLSLCIPPESRTSAPINHRKFVQKQQSLRIEPKKQTLFIKSE